MLTDIEKRESFEVWLHNLGCYNDITDSEWDEWQHLLDKYFGTLPEDN